MALVVRNDEGTLRRYVHLATGNYNPSTAKLYTDIGLLTCRPEFGEDTANLFNLLTGISRFQGARRLLVAPFALHNRLLEFIDREIANARRGLPARIILKLNALVDEKSIEALYRASNAGVQIELIIRGTCCLRPGVAGVSENIRVVSIVDRFLEHSRLYYFENACQPEVWVASADWMPRNFFRRIEIAFPIEDGRARERLIEEVLAISLADTSKARILRPDGTYDWVRSKRGSAPRRSQNEFMELARKDTGRGLRRNAISADTEMQLRPGP
jgi:polyphosphate kinase